MSVSEHPIALRLERRVGGATKLLAVVMALPLIDGIFPALVLAGALSTTFGVVETGLLIFGGSATMAVILAEMDGTRRQQATSVLLIGAVIVPVAAAQAALAPTLAGLLNLDIFGRFAGLVILAIAAKTASAKVGDLLPSPGVIVALGLVASFEPAGFAIVVSSDPTVVGRGAAAAGVGVAFALGVALAAPQLRGCVNIDRFRFGSAVALGVLALPILGVLNTDAPIALAVLAVTGLFAYDPDPDGGDEARSPTVDDHDDRPDGAAPGSVGDASVASRTATDDSSVAGAPPAGAQFPARSALAAAGITDDGPRPSGAVDLASADGQTDGDDPASQRSRPARDDGDESGTESDPDDDTARDASSIVADGETGTDESEDVDEQSRAPWL